MRPLQIEGRPIAMPAIELTKLDGTAKRNSPSLHGKKATVVVFWKGDRRMTAEAARRPWAGCLERSAKMASTSSASPSKRSRTAAKETLNKSGAKFTNLLDAEGKAFAQIGKERLPAHVSCSIPTAKSCGSISRIL